MRTGLRSEGPALGWGAYDGSWAGLGNRRAAPGGGWAGDGHGDRVSDRRTAGGAAIAGHEQDDFGKLINYSGSHVSAVETGQRPPRPEYLAAVDQALQTGGIFTRLMGQLASLDSAPVWLRDWIVIERETTSLRWYEPAFVPGLLQTENYARATLRAGGLLTPDEVEQRVMSRLERQDILTRERPPQFVAVLDEAVLRRTVSGDRSLMAEQLEHLAKCAEQPHAQILVVPAEVGVYPGLQGGFILAALSDGSVAAHLDHQVRA